MNSDSFVCAVCGQTVYMDDDHVEIEAETVRMNDRNETDDYLLHTGCAMRTMSGWSDPA